ncbi:MAG TPA: phosphate ABC transporter permease subunit PstC [Candidatus Limiplasma sp.]|nr:phosphate ABC transporter permease subunit PstC [Candidatus Limiplasma sp.]HRX08391.1 phosphate ABC transporter permease subunit PstC [Candidatus Limiplasma sp.]
MKLNEKAMRWVFTGAAFVSVAAVLLICVYLFMTGIPFFGKVNILEFLSGTTWKPLQDIFGILPMIVGSIYVTAGAILLGGPIGILGGVYMARFCPKKFLNILQPMIALMAGIPSVVYGFFGIRTLVPFVRNTFGGTGFSILTASLLLAMMILPTIIQLTYSSIKAVPESYFEGSLALGTSEERSVFRAVLPAAKSGIMAALVLGIGRAIGETMAVVMVAGNQARMPAGILKGIRTLTTNIVTEMGYAADLHREALIATGVVLFVFILLINLLFSLLNRRTES